MGVCHAEVRCSRDHGRLVLVGDIVDGEGVLVEAEANLAARVSSVGAVVDDALEIVCVTKTGDSKHKCRYQIHYTFTDVHSSQQRLQEHEQTDI